MVDHDTRDRAIDGAEKDRAAGAFDEAKGRVKGAVGELTGDEKLQGEGKADRLTGKVKQGVADAKDAVNDAVRNVTDRSTKR